MYLEKINSPEDVKKLNIEEMKVLAEEIREAVIKRDAIHGGHFGPNLGMVEATIALHYVFDSPKDKFVFDVSHQSYPHKMLTGRREAFTEEAHYDDVTGYSNQHESEHDHFILGHTSTSISLALGLAKARDVKGETGNVVAIIGDGSLSGGEALEGLDFAGELANKIVDMTEGFTGADLESTVRDLAYRVIANEDFVLDEENVVQAFSNVVPLSQTSPEKIAAIRDWGKERAVPASGKPIGAEEIKTNTESRTRKLLV